MGIWSWLMGAFGGCKHEWERYTAGGEILRGCVYCPRLEKLEPRSGVWMEVKR